jgi:hypothetical protein
LLATASHVLLGLQGSLPQLPHLVACMPLLEGVQLVLRARVVGGAGGEPGELLPDCGQETGAQGPAAVSDQDLTRTRAHRTGQQTPVTIW